jgi:hypothetical protein
MASYGNPLDRVLRSIQQATPVSISDYKEDGEWFLIESDSFEDPALFSLLSQRWRSIAGLDAGSFALIHCRVGTDPGVWLHYMETASERQQSLAGCHQISCW